MIAKEIRNEIISLIHREVVPAIGCTEPVAVALAVAKATETLGAMPEKIDVALSGNMLKNAMGVGIPGTGMIGLPIAIALGAIVGKSEYGLEVLRDVNAEAVEKGKEYIAEGRISISHDPEAPSKLHIDVKVAAGKDTARVVISGSHTNYILVRHGDETLLEKEAVSDSAAHSSDIELSLATVYEFATETPLDEIRFILEARNLNKNAAEFALKGDYGHSLGSLHLRRMRCQDGRRPDSRDVEFRQRQPGHNGYHARRIFRRGYRSYRGAAYPRPHPFPPHFNLHQAEPRSPVRPLRLRSGFDRS